jgi:hypothetical protein
MTALTLFILYHFDINDELLYADRNSYNLVTIKLIRRADFKENSLDSEQQRDLGI